MTTEQGQKLAVAIALVANKYGYHLLAAMTMPQYQGWGGTDEEFFVNVRNWIRRIPNDEAVEGLDLVSMALNTVLAAVKAGAKSADAYGEATEMIREISDSDADPILRGAKFRPYP